MNAGVFLLFLLLATGSAVANSPPTISRLPNMTLVAGSSGEARFTITDAETPPERLSLRLISSHQAILPETEVCGRSEPGFCFSGSGTDRAVTLSVAPEIAGSVLVEIIVTDEHGATAATSFWLLVQEIQDLVTISSIRTQVATESTSTEPYSFLIGYTRKGEVTVIAESFHPQLVPSENILIEGDGQERTLTITPAPGQSGQATLILTAVAPTGAVASRTFFVQVQPRLKMELIDHVPVVIWTSTNAILQEASTIDGPWRTVVPNPTSPYRIEEAQQKFFRLLSF